MGKRSVAIPFTEVDQLTGSKDAGPSEGHPKVREELARQGLDLALPTIAWPDEEQQAWCYRNLMSALDKGTPAARRGRKANGSSQQEDGRAAERASEETKALLVETDGASGHAAKGQLPIAALRHRFEEKLMSHNSRPAGAIALPRFACRGQA